jgi:hypothetical protein
MSSKAKAKAKVKVAESNYGSYSIKRTVSGLGNDVFTMSYSEDSNWVDTFQGAKIMKLVDNGDGVDIKDFSEYNGFGKLKLDYSAIFELYVLLSYYFKEMKGSYSEFEFVENSSISSAPNTSSSSFTAQNSSDETLVTDKHVLAVIQQLKDRSIAGQKKYNTNLERGDLSIQDWLQHAQEETLDFANYLQVLKEKFQ